MKESVRLTVRYEGQMHQMDLDVLIASLMSFASLTRAVAAELVKDVPIEIRISAPERGSFPVDLELIKDRLTQLVVVGLPYLSQAVRTMLDILQVKRFLKGGRPDHVEERGDTTVLMHGGSQLTIAKNVYNIYGANRDVNEHMARLFGGLRETAEVEGYAIEAPGVGDFRALPADFTGMACRNELLEDTERREVVRANLTIIKLVFEKERVWEFIFQGNKISATVADQVFWSRVDSRAVGFSKGDRLVVDLEIAKTFDQETNEWLNRSYRILTVYDHQLGPTQMSFPDYVEPR